MMIATDLVVPSNAMNAKEWLAEYAARLGTDPPTRDEFAAILDVAAAAAHASERVAAPAATWLAARAGRPLPDAVELAKEIAPEAD
jgi:Domain of unknown function (DUF6457)